MAKILHRCRKCLIPSTRPSTAFVDDVCSGCIAYESRAEIDWSARAAQLREIVESAKPNRDGFNVIVPSSGGKDSTFQVLKLIELGAKPLVVTASTCMLTSTGRYNIANLARYATTIEVTPNRRVRALLNRLGLELLGDISWPEHVSINATPWRIARDFGIKTIFYGEAGTTEYGGPLDVVGASKMTRRWITEFGGHLDVRPSDFVGQHGLTREDLAPYQMPTEEEMEGIDAFFLGAFIPWNSHRNAKVATEAGMMIPNGGPCESNWWHAENLDNAQTGIHDYFGFLKYGYNRLCAQISVDIRYGMISREEAIPVVRDRDHLFPFFYMGVHYKDMLDYMGISEDRFVEICNDYANRNLFNILCGYRQLPEIKRDVWEASFC